MKYDWNQALGVDWNQDDQTIAQALGLHWTAVARQRMRRANMRPALSVDALVSRNKEIIRALNKGESRQSLGVRFDIEKSAISRIATGQALGAQRSKQNPAPENPAPENPAPSDSPRGKAARAIQEALDALREERARVSHQINRIEVVLAMCGIKPRKGKKSK